MHFIEKMSIMREKVTLYMERSGNAAEEEKTQTETTELLEKPALSSPTEVINLLQLTLK